jgi:magnesium chelatase accessory protein
MNARRITAGSIDWHIEEAGQGAQVLLVHGTAASAHSWRRVAENLAASHHVLNVDLPGHGQSIARESRHMSLAGMTDALAALLSTLSFKPKIAVGHSAGAVILARLCARHDCAADQLFSFNGAFFPFSGAAGQFFSPFAKMAAAMPFLPTLLSSFATRQTVERLLRDTGSALTAEDIDAYYHLFKKPTHVSAALDMMANWDLSETEQDLRALTANCTFIAGANDKTIPPASANRAASLCVKSVVHILPELGHLLHEERPALAAAIIRGEHTWQA